jgi:hypothetical protein
MLDVVIGLVVGLLLLAGILVMLGPTTGTLIRRARDTRVTARRTRVPSVFQAAQPREAVPAGLNPKTQRVLVAAARLGNWLRAHGHDDLSRELRSAGGKITGNEAAGLYAMQMVLRRLRSLSVEDRTSQERLKSLTTELRIAVQDRFEQLELLPFKRP